MTKDKKFTKYVWVIMPILLALIFVWRIRQGGTLCSSMCQCAGRRNDQGM
jgi:hypothetical protein